MEKRRKYVLFPIIVFWMAFLSNGCEEGNIVFGSPSYRQDGPELVGLSYRWGPGLAGPGLAGPGLAGPGLSGPGLAGPGLPVLGREGPGLAGPGFAGPGLPGLGREGPGLAGPGFAAPGFAGSGLAVLGREGPGNAILGREGPGNAGNKEVCGECISFCPLTCENIADIDTTCPGICKAGCECMSGFLRRADGKCVIPHECPQRWTICGENDLYGVCQSPCPLTCENYGDTPKPCKATCRKGCQCMKGFVRHADGKCVRPFNCPQKWGPGAYGGGSAVNGAYRSAAVNGAGAYRSAAVNAPGGPGNAGVNATVPDDKDKSDGSTKERETLSDDVIGESDSKSTLELRLVEKNNENLGSVEEEVIYIPFEKYSNLRISRSLNESSSPQVINTLPLKGLLWMHRVVHRHHANAEDSSNESGRTKNSSNLSNRNNILPSLIGKNHIKRNPNHILIERQNMNQQI